MSGDRMTFDGDYEHLDEVVLSGAIVHIERMNQHGWYIGIRAGDRYVHLSGINLTVIEDEGMDDLTEVREPLLGCPVESGTHRCDEIKVGHRGHHMCECGELLR